MSASDLTRFPMENITLNIIPIVCVALSVLEFFCMVEFFSILVLTCRSRSEAFDDSKAQVAKKNPDIDLPCGSENKEDISRGDAEEVLDSKDQVAKNNPDFDLPCSSENKEDISRGDAEEVMERLGIFCSSEDGRLQEKLDPDDLSKLFEEKEPSLDEVKGAFDVFDENSDGFIDSKELQRVLSVLGFKEGGDMENCRRMIGLFDENGDGRIDFGEFVKIMENSFC